MDITDESGVPPKNKFAWEPLSKGHRNHEDSKAKIELTMPSFNNGESNRLESRHL